MDKDDDILTRMLEMSRFVSREKEEKNTSDFIVETTNRFRNTFFQNLSTCNCKQEKVILIQHFISESTGRLEDAQRINDKIQTEIYSKFLKETLYPLKDFTISTEKPNVSEKSDVKPSAPPVDRNIPDSNEDVVTIIDDTLENLNLIGFQEMMKILKYKDKRSIKKWCEENRVPIIELGKNKFIDRSFLEKIISAEAEVKGHRAPINNNVPKAASRKADVTGNEMYLKYLAKYESNSRSKSSS
jgi:hypothetical protein